MRMLFIYSDGKLSKVLTGVKKAKHKAKHIVCYNFCLKSGALHWIVCIGTKYSWENRQETDKSVAFGYRKWGRGERKPFHSVSFLIWEPRECITCSYTLFKFFLIKMSYFNMCGLCKRSFWKVGAAEASVLEPELVLGQLWHWHWHWGWCELRRSCSLPRASVSPSIGWRGWTRGLFKGPYCSDILRSNLRPGFT